MAFSSSTVSFSEGPLFRQLLSFALPLMAVNILQYVYQAVDMADHLAIGCVKLSQKE